VFPGRVPDGAGLRRPVPTAASGPAVVRNR
jgi:hypothetical protein